MSHGKIEELFLDQSNDLIWMVDADLLLTYANQAYLNLMKQVTGKEKKLYEPILVEGFGEGYIEKWRDYYKKALSGEHFEIEEHYSITETNEIKFGQIIFKPIRDENNQVVAVACQSRDITRIVRQRSDAHQLMDASLDVFCTINEAGNFVFVNEAATKHWGYTAQELIGKPYMSFVIQDDISKTNDITDAILSGEEIKSFVNRYKRKDGDIAYNLWSARWDSETKLMYGVARDAKEKIEQENLLLQSEQRFKALVQEGSDLIAILDETGIYKYVSPTTISILGMDPEEFIGKSPFDYIHPEDTERTLNSLGKITTESRVQVEPFRFKNKNGEWRWIETVLTNMLDNPTVNGIVANSRDITAEKKLRELNNVTSNLARIGSWEIDLEGNKLYWSEMVHELHETDPKTFVPDVATGINFYREDFRPLVIEAVNQCIQSGTAFDFEAVLVTANKRELWVRVIGNAELLNGECIRIYGSFQDIHQRKESQLELLKAKELAEENEQKMKQAQKLAHIGSWYYDFVNQVSQWSEETYSIWGLNPAITTVDYVDHQKLIHPKDWERFNAVIKNAIEKGIPYKMDLELVRPDGSYKTVNTIGDPIFDENNKVIAFKGTTQDISDRIIIENELRSAIKKAEESDARFKSYTQQSPIAIYTTDINGDCIYANETWLEMAGMQLEDALGKGWINALHPEDLEYVTDNWYKSIESNGEWNYEYRFVNSNKNIIWVNGNAKKLYNEKNELIGYLGSNVNITERKKAEQEKNSLLTTLEKSLNEIYVFDAETLQFSYANQGALNNLGYSEQEIKELTPLDLKPEFTATTYNQLANPLVTKEKEKIVFFSNHKRKNGTLYPVEIHLQLVVEGNNKRFLAVILDITNLKETEKLLDSASKLARVGSWEIVPQDNEEFKVFWSSMTKNILEIDGSFEPTIANGINFYKEHSRSLIEAAVNNVIETGEAFDLELELVSGKGNDIWVRCIGDAQFENGKVTRVYGSFQDINTRKVAELNQQKLNEEKSTILESIGDAFYALDAELNFTYMNSSCANVLAVEKEIIIGKNLFTEFPSLKNTQFEDELKKVQHTAEATKFEFYYAPYDAWFDESIYPTPTGISVYFVDITQRKKAEAARIMAEKNYQELFDKSNDAIYVHDIDTGQLIDVNNRATELTGFDKMDLLEKDPSILFTDNPEYTMEKAIDYIQKAAQGKPQVFEWLGKKKDGTSCWFEMTLRRTNIAGVDKILAFQRDITERKESESKLIENENYLRTILNTEPECVKVLNSKGELLSMNPAGLAMIEADNEQQVLGHRMTDLVNKEYQLGFNRLSKEVFKGNAGSFEFEITGLKGGCRWLETHAVPLKDTTGKIVNLLGVTRDITDRKNYENQLLKLNESIQQHAHQLELSNEELEQFAFIASHDLQEPLRMISSFLEQLQRKYNSQLDEKAHQYIHFAIDGARRMKQIILDLLEYSRAGKLADSKEVIDMNEILEQYSFLRQKIITEKNVIINISQLPVIKSYKAPLTQTLHCLLDNAIKYSREDQPPHVTISAEELADSWIIRIADNGIGIDPKFFGKIFIIFQRLHNREKFTGNGIGLSIAKKHTESWGGKIWLESEPGKGSIFYFTHPKEIN